MLTATLLALITDNLVLGKTPQGPSTDYVAGICLPPPPPDQQSTQSPAEPHVGSLVQRGPCMCQWCLIQDTMTKV